MGGTAGKCLLVLAVAALIAFAAGGCGGGSDDSGTTATTATDSGKAAPSSQPGDDKGGSERPAGDDKGGAGEAGDDSTSDGGSAGSAGEGSAAFRSKGGDNSIQEFGDEADEGERQAAEDSVNGYLQARADGDWKKSCEYLAAGAVKPLEQLAESSPQLKGKGCAAIIGALSAQMPASSRSNPLVDGVAALRIEGDQAFALFHGPQGTDFFIPLAKEGDEWKVAALAASEFP